MSNESNKLCECGCGQFTKLASRNRPELGWIKGSPLKYVVGHSHKQRGGPKLKAGHKWCFKCKTVKSIEDFHKNERSYCGLQGYCKECGRQTSATYRSKNVVKTRRYSLKGRLAKRYEMTTEEYDRRLADQNHACAICQQPETTTHKGVPRLLAVDHDHQTGIIRGLLCNNCNRGLGLFGDKVSLLEHAIQYLSRVH